MNRILSFPSRLSVIAFSFFAFVFSPEPEVLSALPPQIAERAPTIQLKVKVEFDGYPERPELAEHLKALAIQVYPRIVELTLEPGEKYLTHSTIIITKKLKATSSDSVTPARTAGGKIRVDGGFLESRPAYVDFMMIHELVHMAQNYERSLFRKRPPLCWVEGIANYVPFTLGYTNGFACPQCGLSYPDYTDGYSCAGAFLIYVAGEHGPNVVCKLNTSLRRGTFSEAFFEKETGKNFATLWSDFQRTPGYTPLASKIVEFRQKFRFKNEHPPKDFQKRFDTYLAGQYHGEVLKKWQEALGYTAGKPPEGKNVYLLNDFAKFAYMNTAEGKATRETYLFMRNLFIENRVPWFSKEELRETLLDLPEELYPESCGPRTFFLNKARDPLLYFYRVDRQNETDAWKLVSTWRCKPDGSSRESYPLEGVK